MARQTYETPEYAAMLSRLIRSYARRIADGDPTDLADAVRLQQQLDQAIGEAVAAMRDQSGFSWADLARELGVTRSAVQQRYARYCQPAA